MLIKRFVFIGIVVFILFLHCSTLQQLAQFQKPVVKVDDWQITRFTFQDIDFNLILGIENPNPLAVSLSGFDYQFNLNGRSFVQGIRDSSLRIEGMGKSRLAIPIHLEFKELYNTFTSFKNADSTGYDVQCGLKFNLPVLGPVRIPVKKTGSLPLPKLPEISVKTLRMKKMGFTNADLELVLNVKNPNAFKLGLDAFNYNFAVSGASWLSGSAQNALNLSEKKSSRMTLPIRLNFLQLGSSVMNLLKGDNAITYQFSGDADISTSVPLLKKLNLPIDKSGKVSLVK